MEKIKTLIKEVYKTTLDIVFPTKCIGCNKKHEIICEECLLKVNIVNQTERDDIFALYDYHNPLIKKAIWDLKYYHSPYLGKIFGYLLYESFIEEINEINSFSLGKPIYVLPVPSSNKRKKYRGYNQTEIIARSFCSKTNNKILKFDNHIVYKNRETIPQAKLTNKNKRLKNLKNAFSIYEIDKIKGRTFIIIDDVTTTGGTMIEIINILKEAKAKKVIGLAVAH